MAVAETSSSSDRIMVSAFAAEKSEGNDALIVLNWSDEYAEVTVDISGSSNAQGFGLRS
jgi:hypothetical protein